MENKNYVLAQWDSNWADEMDIEGFAILEEKTWDSLKNQLKSKTGRFDIYIGTNEEIEYSNGSELLKEISIQKMTEEEAKTVSKFMGWSGGFTQFIDCFDDEDEDEDED